MRINELLKADEHSEAGFPPSKELLENLGRFIDEVANAGGLCAAEVLRSSPKPPASSCPITGGVRVDTAETVRLMDLETKRRNDDANFGTA